MSPLLPALFARYRSLSWGQRGYALIVLAAVIVFGAGALNHWRAGSYERMSKRIQAAGARAARSVNILADQDDAYFLAVLGDFSAVAITGVLGNGPDCTVNASLLRDLRRFPEINRLRLAHVPLRHEDFQCIYELENLRWLNLAYDPLTDADLVGMEKLQNLDGLELQFTQLTDASIPTLAKLPGLSSIDISCTDITPAGAERLRWEYRLAQGTQAATTVIHRSVPSPRFRDAVIRLLPTKSYGVDSRNPSGGLRLLLRADLWKEHEQNIPWIAELKDVETVTIQGMPISSEMLEALAKLPMLRQLNLSDISTDDIDLSRLAACPNLRSLRLSGLSPEERFLASLSQVETLETLQIFNCRLSPAACRDIAKLRGLKSLSMQQLDVDPEAFAHLLSNLASSSQLRLLDLSLVPIHNGTISRLAKLTQLTSLSLSSKQIDDDAVPELCNFTHLQQLDISGTRISLPGNANPQDGETRLEAALLPAKIRVVHPRSTLSTYSLSLEELNKKSAEETAAEKPAQNGTSASAAQYPETPSR